MINILPISSNKDPSTLTSNILFKQYLLPIFVNNVLNRRALPVLSYK